MITNNYQSVKFKREYKVDVQTLFDAWKNPEIFRAWWKDLSVVESDFRIGGKYKLVWIQDPSDSATGEYKEIIENQKIAFTWETWCRGEKVLNSLVTLTFTAVDAGTARLELVHDYLGSEESVDRHHLGWTVALIQLDKFYNDPKSPVRPEAKAVIERTFDYPVQKVYEAWSDPNFRALWFNRRTATLGKAMGEPIVGKSFTMDYQYESGNLQRIYCECLEVDPRKKLVFLWADGTGDDKYNIEFQHESRVTVTFSDLGASTKVTIVHDQVTSEKSVGDYREGWTDCLASIEDRLSRSEKGLLGLRYSPFIDLRVSEPALAAEFYARYFGWMPKDSSSGKHTLMFGPVTVFINEAEAKVEKSNVHFEMVTKDDIEGVKTSLEAAGCTSCKSSVEKAYMFTDPFGNNFHIYQN